MLETVAEAGELLDRIEIVLFLGIYLMAQIRENRAFPPLCIVAANRDMIDRLIGNGIAENLSIILARTHDGDLTPLRALIENVNADELVRDEFVRDAGVKALAWLTVVGQIDREETALDPRDLHTALQPQNENYVWVGWQQAIAVPALADLTPLVEDAFSRGFISDTVLGFKHFMEDLRAAQASVESTEVFKTNPEEDRRFDDIATHMSGWECFQPAEDARQKSKAAPRIGFQDMGSVAVRNPYRSVGRNEPCPCGSGKKYKKHCLVNAA